LPHVSEEAAALGKITGEGGPELEQGTPVQEVLERDADGKKNAPQVLKEQPKSDPAKGTRSFSTSARRRQEALIKHDETRAPLPTGLKFDLPPEVMQKAGNLRYRYDEVVDQITKMLMKDGKLSAAQRNINLILNHLRTTPAPSTDPRRPLLEGNAPSNQLPLDPIQYLTLAIDSVAPLLRIRSQRGAAGGGVALQIPIPLRLRQRRRAAMKWILDAAENRQSGGGRDALAKKVADEIVAVVEGRSSVCEARGGYVLRVAFPAARVVSRGGRGRRTLSRRHGAAVVE